MKFGENVLHIVNNISAKFHREAGQMGRSVPKVRKFRSYIYIYILRSQNVVPVDILSIAPVRVVPFLTEHIQ